jgi:hypothetical protein
MLCQFCKEEIKEAAIKCKHCGASLTPYDSAFNHNVYEHRITAPATNTLAIISLVLGLGGILFAFFAPFISQVVSIICGHIARSQIKASNGSQTGEGMALAGLIISYITLCILFLVAISAGIFLSTLL